MLADLASTRTVADLVNDTGIGGRDHGRRGRGTGLQRRWDGTDAALQVVRAADKQLHPVAAVSLRP